MQNKKYISAVRAAEIISDKLNVPLSDLADILADVPAADVAEVRYGVWRDNVYYKMDSNGVELFVPDDDYVCCSECNGSLNKLDNCVEEFVCCPYCGTKMDGEPR